MVCSLIFKDLGQLECLDSEFPTLVLAPTYFAHWSLVPAPNTSDPSNQFINKPFLGLILCELDWGEWEAGEVA